jgi:phosphinothricin acetyltransferase
MSKPAMGKRDRRFAPVIRSATEADAPALLAVYAPYVEHTAISFETEVPSPAEFAARIAKAATGWAWLVAEADGECLGYAYGCRHRERAAYRWSVETSAYVAQMYHRQGVARALYTELLTQLTRLGYCNAYAGVTLPNEASLALHRTLGFEPVGVFRRIGYKFGVWHDVAWFQRALREEVP